MMLKKEMKTAGCGPEHGFIKMKRKKVFKIFTPFPFQHQLAMLQICRKEFGFDIFSGCRVGPAVPGMDTGFLSL